MDSSVRLAIPPQPDQARVARLVVGTAARTAGIAEERIDDIRLAVSEAVAVAMSRHRSYASTEDIVLTLTEAPGWFHVQVLDAVDVDPHTPSTSGQDAEQIAAILMAELADSLVWEQHPAGWCARLSWTV